MNKTNIDKMIDLGESLIGKVSYKLGAEWSPSQPFPPKYLDCSEFIQLLIWKIYGIPWIDGAANQYNACKSCTLSYALDTPGVLFFKKYPLGRVHHVGMYIGMYKGQRSIIDCNTPYGVGIVSYNSTWNRWGLIPFATLDYQEGLKVSQYNELMNEIAKLNQANLERFNENVHQEEEITKLHQYNLDRFNEIQRILNEIETKCKNF